MESMRDVLGVSVLRESDLVCVVSAKQIKQLQNSLRCRQRTLVCNTSKGKGTCLASLMSDSCFFGTQCRSVDYQRAGGVLAFPPVEGKQSREGRGLAPPNDGSLYARGSMQHMDWETR